MAKQFYHIVIILLGFTSSVFSQNRFTHNEPFKQSQKRAPIQNYKTQISTSQRAEYELEFDAASKKSLTKTYYYGELDHLVDPRGFRGNYENPGLKTLMMPLGPLDAYGVASVDQEEIYLIAIARGSILKKHGVNPGDKIVKINGKALTAYFFSFNGEADSEASESNDGSYEPFEQLGISIIKAIEQDEQLQLEIESSKDKQTKTIRFSIPILKRNKISYSLKLNEKIDGGFK